MSYKVELEGGKYTFTNDNGIVSFERYGEPSNAYLGNKAVYLLLSRIERLERTLHAYRSFEGEVSSAAHKVNNSRLDDAMEMLQDKLFLIEEEFE